MENLKIKVKSKEESAEVQGLLFELGYVWYYNLKPVIENVTGTIKADDDGTMVSGDVFSTNHKEISIQKLKDMVVLKRNDIKDSTHYCRDNGENYFVSSKGEYYFWFIHKCEWYKSSNAMSYLKSNVKPIMEKEMKEYLAPVSDGDYLYMKDDSGVVDSDWIEIPLGSECFMDGFVSTCGAFYKDGFKFAYSIDKNHWEKCSFDLNKLKSNGGVIKWERNKVNKAPTIKPLFDNQYPCLPVYKVSDDVGSSFDHNKVDFTLKYGVNDIICSMDAEVNIEAFDIFPQGKSPENSIERNFKYMQVVSNIVEILEHDIELMTGQKIELTEVQFNELNEKLKDAMVMV